MNRHPRIKLFGLHQHQSVVAKALATDTCNGAVYVVNACRQVGKSYLATHQLIKYASTGKVSAFVTTSFRLAKNNYDLILKLLRNTIIVARSNAQDLNIEFTNGAKISFFSAEQRDKLRGYTVSGILIIDEASFISDTVYYDYLRAWVNVHQAPTLILSTPDFERGFFYDFYQRGLKGDPLVHSFNFMDYPDSIRKLRSDEALEEARRALPPQTFRSEYLGLFRQAEGAVFGNFKAQILQTLPASPTKLFVGIDWAVGGGGDYTVVTAFNQNHQLCYLWRDNEHEPTKQIEHIANYLKVNRQIIETVVVEKNSMGGVYLSMLREKVRNEGIKVIPFQTTNDSKRKLIETMQVDIQNGVVWFTNDRDLLIELASFEANINGKIVRYSAPTGQHDDIVMSLLFANEAYHRRDRGIRYLG